MPKRKKRAHPSSGRRQANKSKRTSSLAGMTLDALMTLRDNVERIIATRAKAERTAIENQMARLSSFVGGGAPAPRRKSPLKGRKVPPKYRNPANRSETWSGRGARPRWLQAIAGPIASVLFRREVRRRLKALKSYLERSE